VGGCEEAGCFLGSPRGPGQERAVDAQKDSRMDMPAKRPRGRVAVLSCRSHRVLPLFGFSLCFGLVISFFDWDILSSAASSASGLCEAVDRRGLLHFFVHTVQFVLMTPRRSCRRLHQALTEPPRRSQDVRRKSLFLRTFVDDRRGTLWAGSCRNDYGFTQPAGRAWARRRTAGSSIPHGVGRGNRSFMVDPGFNHGALLRGMKQNRKRATNRGNRGADYF
jgi:hypothetical protein